MGVGRHFGFDRKWILTIPLLSLDDFAQRDVPNISEIAQSQAELLMIRPAFRPVVQASDFID